MPPSIDDIPNLLEQGTHTATLTIKFWDGSQMVEYEIEGMINRFDIKRDRGSPIYEMGSPVPIYRIPVRLTGFSIDFLYARMTGLVVKSDGTEVIDSLKESKQVKQLKAILFDEDEE